MRHPLQEERILAGVAHLGYLIPGGIGALIAFVIYLLKREKSYFIAQHARQAIGFQLAILVLGWLLSILGSISLSLFRPVVPRAFGLGSLFFLIPLALAGLAIYGAINAFRGRHYRYPLIGDWIPDE